LFLLGLEALNPEEDRPLQPGRSTPIPAIASEAALDSKKTGDVDPFATFMSGRTLDQLLEKSSPGKTKA